MSIDLASIGRELKKPVENIEIAVKLLDEGNTIPFITRFRKDQTGGLSEEQLAIIKSSVARLRALTERKAFVSKSIESQEKLTDEIRLEIEKATSTRELEYVYLPFKPKKQTLATVAKQNGLEPLALDVFEGREPEKDLASRATDFVRVDKNLNSIDEVIAGVRHILAEKFSDNATLRNELRGIISSGKLTTKLIQLEENEENSAEDAIRSTSGSGGDIEGQSRDAAPEPTPEPVSEPQIEVVSQEPGVAADATQQAAGAENSVSESNEFNAGASMVDSDSAVDDVGQAENSNGDARDDSSDTDVTHSVGKTEVSSSSKSTSGDPPSSDDSLEKPKTKKSKAKKKKKKKKVDDPYKEFHEFSHAVAKMPYYKTLAINRGEKNGRLKVRITYDEDKFLGRAYNELVPRDHPFQEFLQECVKDGMSRLVAPSLEREARREITEAAEKHAVQVFARNLKNLMLQSPVRDHRVLAIDPGYKRGCSVAVLDRGGQLLANAHVFVVGNDKRKVESKEKLIQLIKEFEVSLIAIGNGAACREAEQMISDMLVESFADGGLKYAMVNEAGASFYSTSEVGREEFPDLSPAVRSAVSIGRRLIDPLSELVKISPANIGVGLYQHDVKAKHLAESLDDVVQSCVNRVGVDVNTASTSLLKYVSGLNQLTARRVYEYREEHGPFKNREELKKVSGFGDATYVQSAGFLRIHRGNQPLDTTSVHPEHYDIALKIIGKVNARIDELFPIAVSTASAEQEVADTDTGKSMESTDQTIPTGDPANESSENHEPAEVAESAINDSAPADEPNASGDVADSTAKVVECEAKDSNPESMEKQAPTPPPVGLSPDQLKRRKEVVKAIRELDTEKLSQELGLGKLLIQDIVLSICRPEYDPRSNFNRPVFRSGIIKIDDLAKEMQLDAQVVNVVDFGVFVDIGLGTSCLVHVSQLANHFIRDPHRFYAVGDSLRVWVTEVETEQRRVKLTALPPKSARAPKASTRKSGKPVTGSKFKRGQKPKGGYKQRRPAKPKPVKPITDDMLTGAEPMRSFSDLAQFFNKQTDEKNDGKS